MNEKIDVLIAKALKDPKFKAALVANPAAVIEKETGLKVPPGMSVKVVEDTGASVHLVLPHVAEAKSGRLDDKELEGIAGGAGFGSLVCAGATWTMYKVC